MGYRFSNSVRILSSLSIKYGGVAHLVERIPCTDKVAGSIPVASTKKTELVRGECVSGNKLRARDKLTPLPGNLHPVSDKATAEELRWMHTPQNVWCVGVTDGGTQLAGLYGN